MDITIMSKQRKIVSTPKEFLQIVENLLSEKAKAAKVRDVEKYYMVSSALDLLNKHPQLEDVYDRLIGSLQNRNMMPSVIQYWSEKRNEPIKSILCNCNPKAIMAKYQGKNELDVYQDIRLTLQETGSPITEKDGKISTLWRTWCKGILSAARFLSQFEDVDALKQSLGKLYNDSWAKAALPAMLAMEIEGMQFTLACDFLKECGYDYPKPDVHITDVFEEICGTRDTYQIYKKVIEFAEELRKEDKSMTAYKLDKMIWLICSGSFYLDDIDVGSFKDELIHRLGMTAIKDRPWYKDAEKKKEERNKK